MVKKLWKFLLSVSICVPTLPISADLFVRIQEDAISVQSISDINNNFYPEIVVLRLNAQGVPTLNIRDSVTRELIKTIEVKDGSWEAKGFSVAGDIDGNGADELAVLIQKKRNGRNQVVIVDSLSGETKNTLWYAPVTPVVDIGVDEIVVDIDSENNTFQSRITIVNTSMKPIAFGDPDIPKVLVEPQRGIIFPGQTKIFTLTGPVDAFISDGDAIPSSSSNSAGVFGTDLSLGEFCKAWGKEYLNTTLGDLFGGGDDDGGGDGDGGGSVSNSQDLSNGSASSTQSYVIEVNGNNNVINIPNNAPVEVNDTNEGTSCGCNQGQSGENSCAGE